MAYTLEGWQHQNSCMMSELPHSIYQITAIEITSIPKFWSLKAVLYAVNVSRATAI